MASSCRVIDYTSKSIVVTGETKPLKNRLKELGGRFNPNLTSGPGWVFNAVHRDKVEAFLKDPKSLGENGSTATVSKSTDSSSSSSSSKYSAAEDTSKTESNLSNVPYIVQYSEKSVAVFGDSRGVKDKFKEMNGRFNKFLNYKGIRQAGWIFPHKCKLELQEILTEHYGADSVRPIGDEILSVEESKEYVNKKDNADAIDTKSMDGSGRKRHVAEKDVHDDDIDDDFLVTGVPMRSDTRADKSPVTLVSSESSSVTKKLKHLEAVDYDKHTFHQDP